MADLEQHRQDTVQWLNARFELQPGVPYRPHQPVYGFLPSYLAHFRLAYGLVRRVRLLSFSSFIDIGGAEGYLPNLVKQLYGDSVLVYNLDISLSAIRTASQFYQLRNGVVADVEELPLPDKSVDLVFCNDVIEHVPDPQKAIREMERVAAKYLIVSTDEISLGAEKSGFTPDLSHPHGHLHCFTKEDMYKLMGPDIVLESFRSTLLYTLICQEQMDGAAKLRQLLSEFFPSFVMNMRSGNRRLYWALFTYLVRHILLATAGDNSSHKEKWMRRRLIDDLVTDEWLSIRFPMCALSLIAVKDCGGGKLPAPIKKPAVDDGLLDAMWARGSVDKSLYGHDDNGCIYVRPKALSSSKT